MRILLKNSETQLFYRRSGEWVRNPADATDFEEPERVLEQAELLGRKGLEMLGLNDDGRLVWGQRIRSE